MRLRKRQDPPDPVLDVPIVINDKPTTLRQCQEMAIEMRDLDWQSPAEKGLAITILYLIDRLQEQKGDAP